MCQPLPSLLIGKDEIRLMMGGCLDKIECLGPAEEGNITNDDMVVQDFLLILIYHLLFSSALAAVSRSRKPVSRGNRRAEFRLIVEEIAQQGLDAREAMDLSSVS